MTTAPFNRAASPDMTQKKEEEQLHLCYSTHREGEDEVPNTQDGG